MTKVIILGEATPEQAKKPIEFKKWITSNLAINNTAHKPKEYANIELICRNYTPDLDLMFAYDGERSNGLLFLGHFNDGIV